MSIQNEAKSDMMSNFQNTVMNYIHVLKFSVQMEVSTLNESRILNDYFSKFLEKMTHCHVCHMDTIFAQKMTTIQ